MRKGEWFAWYPVKLARFVYYSPNAPAGYWEYTGDLAWLQTVRVVTTIWNETFYIERRPGGGA